MIGDAAHGTYVAAARALDASRDVSARNKSRIALVFVAELAHLVLAARCQALGRLVRAWGCGYVPSRVTLVASARLASMVLILDLFFVLHQHHVTVSVALSAVRVVNATNELHLVLSLSGGLSSGRELLSVLCPLVNYWHVFQVVDI